MQVEEQERQGFYRKHGRGERFFRSFVPTPLQHIVIERDEELERLLNAVHQRLKETRQDDALEREASASVSIAHGDAGAKAASDTKADAIKQADEAYLRDAMAYALERMQELPLSGRLLKDIHWVMMRGEHNEKKYPGEFRTSPVWIGSKDDSLSTAAFVPPVDQDMDEAFDLLEKYMNYEDKEDPLIMAALIHYQFEVIHPFIDGNGRVGRLLTLLFLIDRGIIDHYSTAPSDYFNTHQLRYFTGISCVEMSGMYTNWVKYFLRAFV